MGLDTFHRFQQSTLLKELYRVVKAEGAILFPHVHLSNAEPTPFFERGCRQLHGTDYDAFFQAAAASSGRSGYLLPEPEMFLFNELSTEQERPIVSDPTSTHYNTSIAILPTNWEREEKLRPFRFDDLPQPEEARILINPLLEIDWNQQEVRQNPAYLSDQVGYLLARHPVYQQKLVIEEPLTELDIKILYWAKRLLNIKEIAARLETPVVAIIQSVRRLQAQDIVQLVPLSVQHLRLQYFVSTQEYHVPYAEQNLRNLWQRAQQHFPTQPYLFSEADDSEMTYAEADALVTLIRQALLANGLQAGDHIMLIGRKHFEGILTVHAASHLGMVIVPLDPEMAPEMIKQIIKQVSPKLVLTDQLHASWLQAEDVPVIQLDEEAETPGLSLFSDWLEENMEDDHSLDLEQHPSSEDLACVLFTSGSTGIPKGVPLTHGQLFRSGRLVTETFHWQANDRFFSPGELDSMSGFRNYCVAPLEVGAAIILPSPAKSEHLFSLVETIDKYQANLLGTTPPLLNSYYIKSDYFRTCVVYDPSFVRAVTWLLKPSSSVGKYLVGQYSIIMA